MLNELLIIEDGARRANVEMPLRHPDIKDARRMPTLLVRLGASGRASAVRAVSAEVVPWTLRDGQHNSFPFHQPKEPLLVVSGNPDQDEDLKAATDNRSENRRKVLLELAAKSPLNLERYRDWPGDRLLGRVRDRQSALDSLQGTPAEIVPSTFERFLKICESEESIVAFLESLFDLLVRELKHSASSDLEEIATSLLLGKYNKRLGKWACTGGLQFEASGYERSILDGRLIGRVTEALTSHDGDAHSRKALSKDDSVCGLTGRRQQLVADKFPQPNISILGQTFLFAKNTAIPANDRYGRFSADAMPVGQQTAVRLAAAFRAITSAERKDTTWRSLPGEAPKQTDLLLAYVDSALDEPVVGIIAGDGDFEVTDSEAVLGFDSVADFLKRTERVIHAIQGRKDVDFTKTPVRIAVIRKTDPANRKVIYSGAPTVAQLRDAAIAWEAGERNVPSWIVLPVSQGRSVQRAGPPHVAPLALIAFTKQLFIEEGKRREETRGIPASEALALFLRAVDRPGTPAFCRAIRVLQHVLQRRSGLMSATAHALRKGIEAASVFDRAEALRTITVLGNLLHKIGRPKEIYMNDAAFQLGQLLAGFDVVHVGYCADMRGGDVPPSLLGNQVLPVAQASPVKAIDLLGRRWKPYAGWVKRAQRKPERIEQLKNSKKRAEVQRGWDIAKALRHAREMEGVAERLRGALAECTPDDRYRAELLLGYVAGFPPAKASADDESPQSAVAK